MCLQLFKRPARDSRTVQHWVRCGIYSRVRNVGADLAADTTIRLWHIGTYRYGWEDAGKERERFGDFTLHLGPSAACFPAGPDAAQVVAQGAGPHTHDGHTPTRIGLLAGSWAARRISW